MSTRPACVGRSDLFDSGDLLDHIEARALCEACPMLAACRKEQPPRMGPRAYVGTWAGQLVGVPVAEVRRQRLNLLALRGVAEEVERVRSVKANVDRVLTALSDVEWADRCLAHVCDGFALGVDDLLGRERRHADARHVLMWLLRAQDWTLPRIGAWLGGMNHTSVLYGVRRVDGTPELLAAAWGLHGRVVKGRTAASAAGGDAQMTTYDALDDFAGPG